MSSRSGLALLGHRLCRRQVFEVTLSALCDRRRKVTRKRKKAMLEFCSCSNLMASADRTSDTVLCHARTRRYRRRRLLSYLVQNKLLDAHKSPALCLSARTLFVTATLGVPAGRNSTISAHWDTELLGLRWVAALHSWQLLWNYDCNFNENRFCMSKIW